ncbi:hypothetical protein JH06_5126 [Blastocystis sp. subtype 4]|uniref:hypothetical protein n=1 Tax=Blastocystis sp. subtype 4 TaxID=944170 RepID=UPI000711F16B|nr:hypothetical protein JH06_5126 [Blastocystis sp. subtype 4]KNB41484.1 hypothetical protein JH06_5126 [Blastocystis sp. subtype 4]|eukprot:XP_014524927.1 hypothetical protein JH06_5126 [Blastocystis sp. subtype 4]
MSEIDISTLPISKIRAALKDLGLSGSGTKKELIERYNEYMKNPKPSTIESNPKENEMTTETTITREVQPDDIGIENKEMKEELPVEQQTFEVDVAATGGDVEGVNGDTATTGNDGLRVKQ